MCWVSMYEEGLSLILSIIKKKVTENEEQEGEKGEKEKEEEAGGRRVSPLMEESREGRGSGRKKRIP